MYVLYYEGINQGVVTRTKYLRLAELYVIHPNFKYMQHCTFRNILETLK